MRFAASLCSEAFELFESVRETGAFSALILGRVSSGWTSAKTLTRGEIFADFRAFDFSVLPSFCTVASKSLDVTRLTEPCSAGGCWSSVNNISWLERGVIDVSVLMVEKVIVFEGDDPVIVCIGENANGGGGVVVRCWFSATLA